MKQVDNGMITLRGSSKASGEAEANERRDEAIYESQQLWNQSIKQGDNEKLM